MKQDFGDQWERLVEFIPIGQALNAMLLEPSKTRRLYAAIDSTSKRHLLIKLQPGEKEYVDRTRRGLTVTTRDLELRGEDTGRYIDIACYEVTGHPALDMIAGELADILEEGSREPADVVKRLIAKWRRFWGRKAQNLLTREEQIGLFAELWFYKNWVYPISNPGTICYWKGPWKHRHDFVFPDRSVEVKASTASGSARHLINGLKQLEPDNNGPLYLLTVYLREEEAGQSLPDLISASYSLLATDYDAIGIFESALIEAGYSPIHEEDYTNFKLSVSGVHLYSVKDDFPRLTTNTPGLIIPPGVDRIRYTIDLQGFDHLIDANGPSEWLERIPV